MPKHLAVSVSETPFWLIRLKAIAALSFGKGAGNCRLDAWQPVASPFNTFPSYTIPCFFLSFFIYTSVCIFCKPRPSSPTDVAERNIWHYILINSDITQEEF